jgi:hypothetical protein
MGRKNQLADIELVPHETLRSATPDSRELGIFVPFSLPASQKNIISSYTFDQHTQRLLGFTPSRCRKPIPGQAPSSTPSRPQPLLPAAWHGEQHELPRSEPIAAPVTWDEYALGVPADAGTVERKGCSEELTSLVDERL